MVSRANRMKNFEPYKSKIGKLFDNMQKYKSDRKPNTEWTYANDKKECYEEYSTSTKCWGKITKPSPTK